MWILEADHARLETTWGAARLDLRHPERGLTDWRWPLGGPLASPLAILQAAPPGGPADSRLADPFVRGSDLIATYGETADQIRVQYYWRELAGTGAGEVVGGVEWLAAVQTLSLDSRPELRVANHFPAGTTIESSTDAGPVAWWLFRPPGSELSYVELMLTADWGGTSPTEVDGVSLGSRLRLERMEKGVIRTCRARSWWVARHADAIWAPRLAAEFFDAPLPLTA